MFEDSVGDIVRIRNVPFGIPESLKGKLGVIMSITKCSGHTYYSICVAYNQSLRCWEFNAMDVEETTFVVERLTFFSDTEAHVRESFYG